MRLTFLVRAGVVVAATAATLALPGTAAAHVTVNPAAGAEADHPAPVLRLTKVEAAAGTPAKTGAQDAAAIMDRGADARDGTTITLSIAALLLGFAGLIAAVLAYRRAGKRRPAMSVADGATPLR